MACTVICFPPVDTLLEPPSAYLAQRVCTMSKLDRSCFYEGSRMLVCRQTLDEARQSKTVGVFHASFVIDSLIPYCCPLVGGVVAHAVLLKPLEATSPLWKRFVMRVSDNLQSAARAGTSFPLFKSTFLRVHPYTPDTAHTKGLAQYDRYSASVPVPFDTKAYTNIKGSPPTRGDLFVHPDPACYDVALAKLLAKPRQLLSSGASIILHTPSSMLWRPSPAFVDELVRQVRGEKRKTPLCPPPLRGSVANILLGTPVDAAIPVETPPLQVEHTQKRTKSSKIAPDRANPISTPKASSSAPVQPVLPLAASTREMPSSQGSQPFLEPDTSVLISPYSSQVEVALPGAGQAVVGGVIVYDTNRRVRVPPLALPTPPIPPAPRPPPPPPQPRPVSSAPYSRTASVLGPSSTGLYLSTRPKSKPCSSAAPSNADGQ